MASFCRYLFVGWWLPVVAPQPTSYGVVAIALVPMGVHHFSPTLLPLFPPPGVTAQVHWVLAVTFLVEIVQLATWCTYTH